MEENELYDRIGETDLNPTYKDGQPYMHTDINQMLGILKTAINENYYDIQRLLNGVKTVGNSEKLDGASFSRYRDEELQSDDNKIPSSQQAKAYMDTLFAGYSAPVRGVDYWTEADQQQIADDAATIAEQSLRDNIYNKNEIDTKFSDYYNKDDIDDKFEDLSIPDNFFEGLPSVSGEGSNISLNNTNSSTFKSLEILGNTEIEPGSIIKNATGEQTVNIFNGTRNKEYKINLGKNIFDKNNFEDLQGYIGGGGNYRTSSNDYMLMVEIKPNTTYTVSKQFQETNNRLRVGISDTPVTPPYNFTLWGGGDSYTSVTITTGPNSKYMYIYYCVGLINKQKIIDTIMIEESNSASLFSEYFKPIELCKLPNYQDKIYKENGKWYKIPRVLKIDSYNGEQITTEFISTTGGLDTGATVYYGNDNPVPIEITVDELLKQLENISLARSYDGTTNISVSGNKPVILNVSAYLNTLDGIKNGINNTIATNSELGLVKVGNGLVIDPDGVLSIDTELPSDIPEYYKDNLENAVNLIKQNMLEAGRDGETFIFITDTHWNNNAKHSPALIKFIVDNTNVKSVIHGGDFLTSYNNKETAIKNLTDAYEAFSNSSNQELLCLFGNHDSNRINNGNYSDRWLSPNEVYELMYRKQEPNVTLWNNETIDSSNLDAQFYYYIDNNATHTRKIFLSSAEKNIGSTQLAWVSNLLNNSAGWNIIIFIHWINSGSEYTADGTALKTLCDQHTDKVKAIIAGHIHYDLIDYTDAGIPIIYTTTDGLSPHATLNADPIILGTISEQAFDVITVNNSTGLVKCVRIGRGQNRTVSSLVV